MLVLGQDFFFLEKSVVCNTNLFITFFIGAAWKLLSNDISIFVEWYDIYAVLYISRKTDHIYKASLLSVRASQSGRLHSSINHTTIAY